MPYTAKLGSINPFKLESSLFIYILKSGKNIMYTFAIMVHIANVYILFLPDFTIWLFELLLTNHRSWN